MAYEDKNLDRLKILIKDPLRNLQKIFPFIKSRSEPIFRRALELINIDVKSRPYPGHDVLLQIIKPECDGFFIECGGNDGYFYDPTYYLEKFRSWTGIIVEPLPIYRLCKKNRNKSAIYNCAAGSFENKAETTTLVNCNAMSVIKDTLPNEADWIRKGEKTQNIKSKNINVPLRPIQSIIDDYFSKNDKRKIDLLTMDVEGYEIEILRGLDFKSGTLSSASFNLREIRNNLLYSLDSLQTDTEEFEEKAE